MKRLVLTVVLFFTMINAASASNIIEPISPAQSSMARTSLVRNLSPSVLTANPALLGFVPNTTAAVYYSRPYGLAELELTNLSMSARYGSFTGGMSCSHSGEAEIIAANIFSMALDYRFLKSAHAGIRWDYRRDSFGENYDDRSMHSLSLGIAYEYDGMIFHAELSEINRPRLCESDPKNDPGYRVGISFMNLSYLVLNLELSGRGEESRFHFAQELLIEKNFFLRLGIVTNPTLPSAGLGIQYSRFTFNYAVNRHSALGETHSFGVDINL